MAGSEVQAYQVDDRRWPLVCATTTAAVNDDAALDATYRALEAQLAKCRRFVLLLDMRGGVSNPQRRQRLAAWGERNASQLAALLTAMGIVAGNNIERGYVTAVQWLRSPPWPLRVFSDPAEAESWLLREYAERNARSPEEPGK